MKNFQNINKLKRLYGSTEQIYKRGKFLKDYSNRKYSIRDFILRLISIKDNQSILDIGCGDCSFLIKLINNYPNNNYYAIDIAKSKSSIPQRIDFKLYDGIKMPFNKHTHDLIFMMNMLYHVKNPQTFLKSVKDISTEKGQIIITTKSKFTFPKIEKHYISILKGFNLSPANKYREEEHFCAENGLKIIYSVFDSKYSIENYKLETQIWVNKMDRLEEYIFSTPRYSLMQNKGINSLNYVNAWRKLINKNTIFIDKYIEEVVIIKPKNWI